MTHREHNAANNSTGVHPTGVIRSNLEIHPLTLNHATSCATSFTVFDNTRATRYTAIVFHTSTKITLELYTWFICSGRKM